MVDCRLKENRNLSFCKKNKNRKMFKENMRLGGSKDYGKGYQQALKDCRVKVRRAGYNIRL